RRQDWLAPVGIEEGPVLEMHIGVANYNGEHNATDKLRDGVLTRFCPQDGRDVGIAAKVVLVVRILPEHLREILHVNGRSSCRAVESPHGESLAPRRARLLGEPLDLRHFDETVVGYHDTRAAREFEHSKFILGDGGEAGGGKLDDPRPSHAPSRNGQASGCFHHGGKLPLNAGKREPEHGLTRAIIRAIGITNIMMGIIFLYIARKGLDDERAGKIGAENSEEEKFALRVNIGKFREILAQVPFGKQVRKERRHAARHQAQGRDEPAGAALEREAQSRALRIVDIALLERKALAVARAAANDTDLASVKAHGVHVEPYRIKLHRV